MFGCDAFVRKFTRKSKKDKIAPEELVLVPEEYKGPQMTKEQLYRRYFLFWQSWQDELISSLSPGGNRKKQFSCSDEALKNMGQMRAMLDDNAKKKLDRYISQTEKLKKDISADIYARAIDINRQRAEGIKRNMLRDFSYDKIKNSLI